MSALAGNTDYQPFGTYTDLLDGNMGADWSDPGGGGVQEMDTEDALTLNTVSYEAFAAIGGFVSQARQTEYYLSRVDALGFDVSVLPIGAIIFGIKIRARACSWDGTLKYELRSKDLVLRLDGAQVGTDESSYTTLEQLGDDATIPYHYEGSETNLWGINPFGYGKAADLGIRWRFAGFHNATSGGPYTHEKAFWVDHIFGQLSWKNTGVMLAM